MSSEAITQNDLREILSRTVGSIPSEYRKLLWTNPSPTSAFSAQTVSLDLSNYDDVEVEFMCWNTEQQEMASVTVAIGASGRMVSPLAVCAFRKFSVTSTGVAFETAQAYPNYGNWALGTQNNACIPYRIYGIKYERVSPPQVDASDYVIEQDTSGIWTYRKWSSGIAECWASVNTSTNFAVWTNPIYYGTTYSARQNFPTGLFIATPKEQVTMYASGVDVWVGADSTNRVSSTQTGRYYPLRVGSGSTATFTTQFYDFGRWK